MTTEPNSSDELIELLSAGIAKLHLDGASAREIAEALGEIVPSPRKNVLRCRVQIPALQGVTVIHDNDRPRVVSFALGPEASLTALDLTDLVDELKSAPLWSPEGGSQLSANLQWDGGDYQIVLSALVDSSDDSENPRLTMVSLTRGARVGACAP